MSDYVKQHAVASTFAAGESWTVLSEIEQSIKRKIEAVGVPLSECGVRINRGILTGFNDAFIIDGATKDRLIAEDPKSAEIIRPILRGRDIKRYAVDFKDKWLIATFPAKKYSIDDYPAVKEFLSGFRPKLEQTGHILSETEKNCIIEHALQFGISIARKDLKCARKRTGNKWYETQDTIAYWDDFSKQKIVWGNLCLKAQFAIAEAGYIVNAPSPIITPGDRWLLAYLNSCSADWYIRSLGVTRNGGYFEYKPMFVERVPIPDFSDKEKEELAQLVASRDKDSISDEKIEKLISEHLGLSEEEQKYLQAD